MKKIFTCIPFLLVCFTAKSQDTTTFEIKFTDGYTEVVSFDYTSIDSCFKNNFSFDFFDIGLFFGNQEPSPLGTCITNFDYHFYPGDNNQYFYGNLYVPILDGSRMMDPNVEDMKVLRVYLEAGFSKAFVSKTKLKDKRLNFYNPDRQEAGYDYTLHMAKLPIYYQSKWMYRGGIGFHQRGINAFAENSTVEDGEIRYNAGSERSLILQAGISKSNYYKLFYNSEGFGSQKAAVINHIYFDLLMAPVVMIKGEVQNANGTTETGSFDAFDELPHNLLGWRFGMRYQGSAVKAKSRGTSAGIEFGSIPGLANGGGYVLFKYGMEFYWN